MSENPASRNRSRRRVVRQAGPPAEDERTGIEVKETVVPSAVDAEAPAADEPAAVEPAAVEPAAVELAVAEVAETGTEAAAEVGTAAVDSEAVPAGESAVVVGEPALDATSDEAEDSAGDDAPKSRIRRLTSSLGRLGTAAAIVALISTLVLLGSGGVFFYHQHRADALNDRRAEYIQVAKQAYINMVTVSDASSGPDIDRLLSVTGGGLKDDLSQNRDDIKKFFEQLKVQSSGKVVAAAIESDDADSASVLLLAQQTVSNAASNGPMQRDYRVRVHVARTGGTVSASSLEMVP
ncbi:hypothetical protein [Nocardia yunnanensis]|uniref:hypothetical protein n=1 Tax=Nocardia yunnanensis TaxID=2382165 RepID=UPI0013C48F16|nr:hypothetical protein [Nocardia yunnanensis]